MHFSLSLFCSVWECDLDQHNGAETQGLILFTLYISPNEPYFPEAAVCSITKNIQVYWKSDEGKRITSHSLILIQTAPASSYLETDASPP